MSDVLTIPIGKIKEFKLSDDGTQVIIGTQQPSNDQVTFALQYDQIVDLHALFTAKAMRKKMPDLPYEDRHAYVVTWFDVSSLTPGQREAS